MDKQLSSQDIVPEVAAEATVQSYSARMVIDGVKTVEIKHFAGEDGTFEELARITGDGSLEQLPGFKVKQVNRSTLMSGAIKAWHLHYNQEDVWFVPPEDHMLLGLWDVRAGSPTKGEKMRVVMGGGKARLVFIPRGVAHGVVNLSGKKGTVLYFVNNTFNPENPDENRLPWDAAGADFWEAKKE